MTKAKMTVAQAIHLAKQADRFFSRAANAWVRGDASGNPGAYKRGVEQSDRYREKAEALLKPLGIEIDYPGLYPSFKINGYPEHSTLNAISAALSHEQKLSLQIDFQDADDLRAFLKYKAKADAQEGTVSGLYCGLMCSALRRAIVQTSEPQLAAESEAA